MANLKALLPPGGASRTTRWETPFRIYDELDKEFGFTLDACADSSNAKHKNFFSSGSLQSKWPGVVWCNPPYGRGIGLWVAKGYCSAWEGATVVMLLPARTDTVWWHDHCLLGEIRFIRGRLKFGNAKNNAPFPSAVVVFYARSK